jgi:mannose-1-phosphate guanylyltransferase/mannose-6-phosphate isomerase
VGLDNVVIVDTPDALLVARRDALDPAAVARRIEARPERAAHRRVLRPWGAFEGIDRGPSHQVKHITVKPGAALSLQYHHHRAEHWIVVRGTARVTCGDRTFVLHENESTFIPMGAVHRLENPGKIPLEMIEVQSGSYLGEDDIVRIEDVYGRTDASS